MPFVSRDPNTGRITAFFPTRQPGIAEEFVPDPLWDFPSPRLEIVMPDTSPTTLNADPIADMDAATKRYVDEAIAEALARR